MAEDERCAQCGGECCSEKNCKIVRKLVDLHGWAHSALKSLSREELRTAHALGHKILDLLNQQQESNPVKFVALFEVISIGSDVLNWENQQIDSDTVTIQ